MANQLETIAVRGKDGLRGTLEQTPTDSASQRLLKLDDGTQVLVPTDALIEQGDGSYYVALGQSDLEVANQISGTRTDQAEIVIPLAQEQLNVTKREIVTGRVRIDKFVREHEETINEPLAREQVTVERIAVNQLVDEAVPVRQEGDTMIIPVLEEVLVVQKRLMLKEEIRVTIQHNTVNEPQTVTLRSEEVVVNRLAVEPPDSKT